MYPSGANRDFVTVGMPDAAVKESRERIKSALVNSGYGFPSKSVTINLAPANVRKEGAGFDLPMALGILGAMGVISRAEDHLFVGELSLDGSLRAVRGALSIAVAARKRGIHNPGGTHGERRRGCRRGRSQCICCTSPYRGGEFSPKTRGISASRPQHPQR